MTKSGCNDFHNNWIKFRGTGQKHLEGLIGSIAKGLALGLAFVTSSQAIADVYIRTIPPAVMIADGQTEYKIDVLADTTEHPSVQFSIWEGKLWVPAGLDFVRVEHPDPINNPSQNANDFFYGWQMFNNPGELFNSLYAPTEATGNSTWPLRTPLNIRNTNTPCQGPIDNSHRLVGSWVFTANPNAVYRTNVKFSSTEDKLRGGCVDYNVLGCPSGACLRRQHGTFSIIPPGDMNMDTLIDENDVQPFVDAMLDPVTYQAQRDANMIGSGDMNLDGQLNGKDIPGFVQKVLGQ